MDLAQLHAYIDNLQKTLATKVEQQRAYFGSQLAGLGILGSSRAMASVRPQMSSPRGGRRKKPEPKYQSKKDRSLKWTGRAMTPVWMRDEMKGTKLKKENFLNSPRRYRRLWA